MAKDAGWRIMRECYDARLGSPLFGSRIVNFVHDEFVVETTDPTVGARVEALMLDAAKAWIPDVKIKVEWSAMTRYSKSDRYTV
jgi:DNA polymerase I-like protein with 3'-5' exonuclease and polymerase domains